MDGVSKNEHEISSAVVQEYLAALHKLERKHTPVRPSVLAKHLKVSPSAVTEMLKRLRDRGLIADGQQYGVVLTDPGRREASRVVRRHRLAERFLVDILGLPWSHAHDEACKLEHALSPESEEGLAKLLGGVDTCPHGNPIPDEQGQLAADDTVALTDLYCNERACIVNITDEDRDELQSLASLGLLPGVEVVLEQKAPFDGAVMIEVGRAKYALGSEVARKIRVRPHHHEDRGRHRRRQGRGHGLAR